MSADPNAYIAEVPCPKCGSKRAVWTPDDQADYECKDCGSKFDPPQIG